MHMLTLSFAGCSEEAEEISPGELAVQINQAREGGAPDLPPKLSEMFARFASGYDSLALTSFIFLIKSTPGVLSYRRQS